MTDTAGPGQDELIRRVRTDRDAFAALYDVFYPKILRYCCRRLYTQSVGEDLTSEVFLTAATKIDSFQGHSAGEFSQWLYAIATNKVNAYLRSTARRRELLEDAARSRRIRLAEPEEKSVDHLDWPAVYEAILQFKPREQSIISLRYMQGMPHEQIAAVLDLKPATVRVALSRAIDKLRKRFNIEPTQLKKGATR